MLGSIVDQLLQLNELVSELKGGGLGTSVGRVKVKICPVQSSPLLNHNRSEGTIMQHRERQLHEGRAQVTRVIRIHAAHGLYRDPSLHSLLM
jgi:hypothetical protein